MARTFTPEEIAEMKAFLRAHPPDPAYDEEDELFDGKLPPEEFKARCVRDILKTWASCPHPTTEHPKHDAEPHRAFSCLFALHEGWAGNFYTNFCPAWRKTVQPKRMRPA